MTDDQLAWLVTAATAASLNSLQSWAMKDL